MNKRQVGGAAACLIAAFFWGVTFIAQDMAAEHIGPFTFQCVRSFIAAAVLFPAAQIKDRILIHRGIAPTKSPLRTLILGGIICGAILTTACVLQQAGIGNNETSPGKDAFVSALYMVIVPVLALFFGKRSPFPVYLCTGVALFGLWLLCMGTSSILSVGDIQVIGCAFVFAVHIIAVDRVAPYVDGIRLSAVQFLTSGVLAGIFMFLFESPTWENIFAAILPLLFAGIFSNGIAYTMQIIGQQRTAPTLASLVLSLESVFAVLASMVLLGEFPSGREIAGMTVIFLAIVCSQLPFDRWLRKKTPPDRLRRG